MDGDDILNLALGPFEFFMEKSFDSNTPLKRLSWFFLWLILFLPIGIIWFLPMILVAGVKRVYDGS